MMGIEAAAIPDGVSVGFIIPGPFGKSMASPSREGGEQLDNPRELLGTLEPADFDKPFTVLRYVLDECDWPMAAKMAYLVLYRHRNANTNTAFPEYRTIARQMHCTPKVAVAAVKTLELAGAVEVQRGRREGGKKRPNVYLLRPPWDANKHAERVPSWNYRTDQVPDGEQDKFPDGEQEALLPDGSSPVTQRAKTCVPTGNVTSSSNKPIEEQANKNTPPPLKRRRTSQPRETPPNPFSADAQKVVAKFNDLLKSHGQPEGVANWAAARKIAENALKGSGGAAPMPVDEALATLDWAFASSPRWRQALMAYGLRNLRSAWAEWKEKGRKGGRKPFAEPLTGDVDDWFA